MTMCNCSMQFTFDVYKKQEENGKLSKTFGRQLISDME